MNNKIINGIALLITLGLGGWFGFKSYLNSHKAESKVEKSEATVSGTQETTDTGVTINNFDHINGTYKSQKTDPPTTELMFETFGDLATTGTYESLEVSASFNGSDQFSIEVIIDAISINTNEPTRDKHLQGEEFFNTDEFSTIEFHSNEITKGKDGYIAKGDITFLGSTLALDIPFKYIGNAKDNENVEIFEGKFTFNPIEYGLESDAGDNVSVSFYTELLKQ